MKENNINLSLGHFLPEYFDKDQIVSSLRDFKFDNSNQWYQKINQKDKKEQQEFIISKYLKNNNPKDLNSEPLQAQKWEEVIIKKLGLVKDQFEDIIYLVLAFFYVHQSYYDGYEFDYSNHYNQNQVCSIIFSIYFIKPEAIKGKESFFIDFFIPEILSTNINTYVSNHIQSLKDFNHITRFIDNIIKPYNKLSNIVYIYDILEGLKIAIQKNENLQTIFEILEQENNLQLDSTSQAKQIYEQFTQMIIDQAINNNDYSNILLISSLCGKEFIKPKIAKMMIHLFELQERNEFLDKYNIQQTLCYTRIINNNLPEYIYKEVATSKIENLIDYLHLHYVEKECPYGNFFIRHMCFHFETVNEYVSMTTDTALKLFKIYKRVSSNQQTFKYISDLKNSTFNNEGYFYEIINRIANKLQKEPDYQTEYEECAMLFMKWSFYYFNQQYFEKTTFAFNLESQFPVYYEKYFQKEIKEIFESQKTLTLEQFKSYPPANYSITRSLLNYLVLKDNLFSQNLIQFFGHFCYYYKYTLNQSIKITKENFQSILKYDLENVSPFCLVTRNIISNYSFMSYFSIKNAEIYDETGKKVENYNYLNAFLELFDQFLIDNKDILQKASTKIKKQPIVRSQKTIINYISSQIKSEQDFEEMSICRRFTYFIQFGLGLFNRIDNYDLQQAKYILPQELIDKIITNIINVYDIKQFYEAIGSQNYEVLNNCNYEESLEFLNLFKNGKLSKIFFASSQKQNKNQEIDIFEQVPFSFIKKLISYSREQPFYPQILNNLASQLIRKCNSPLKSTIQQACMSDDKLNYEEFFQLSAYFNIVMKTIIKNMQSTSHQLKYFAEDESSFISKKRKKKNEIQPSQESNLFYLTDIDLLLKDLIAYQEFILKFLKKEKISVFVEQRAKKNDFDTLFIEFLAKFIESSLNMIGILLSLVHSQNPNYKRSNDSMVLLNRLINNLYIIEVTQLNHGGEWSMRDSSTSQAGEFLDSFYNTIDSYLHKNMDVEPLVKEAQVLYTQFGLFIADNIQRTLNDNAYEVDMINDIIKKIINIDIQIQKAVRKQELREQCRKEILEEESKSENKVEDDKTEKKEEEIVDAKIIEKEQKVNEIELNIKEGNEKESDDKEKEENDKKEEALNEKIKKRMKEKEEKDEDQLQKQIEAQKKDIVNMLSKKIAVLLNSIFKRSAMMQNKKYQITKDIKAILNLPYPKDPIKTYGLNEFFNLCFSKLNSVNISNVKFIHQHLKQVILEIGKYFEFPEQMKKEVPFIKSSMTENKKYQEDSDDELNLFESFTDFYDYLCQKFEILKKNYQVYITLDDVCELYTNNVPSILSQFSLTPSEIQQLYDKCIDISQYLFDLKVRYKNEGVEIEMSSQYISTIETLTEKLLLTLKALNNLVPNMRIQSIESLIQNYLSFIYYKSNPWEEVKESIFYFVNVIFIAKGSANFKHFLRKSIAQDIVTLKFTSEETDQKKEKKKKKSKQKDYLSEDDENKSNSSQSGEDSSEEEDDDEKSSRSKSESSTSSIQVKKKKSKKSTSSILSKDQESSQEENEESSDENLSVLFDIQSFSNEYEIENDDNKQMKGDKKIKNKKYSIDDQIKEQKEKKIDDNDDKKSNQDNSEDEENDEGDRKSCSISCDDDEDGSGQSDESSNDSSSSSEKENNDSSSSSEKENNDSSSSSEKENNDSSSNSSSSSEGDEEEEDKSRKSKESSNQKKKKQIKKSDKEKLKQKKEEERINKNLQNLDGLRLSLNKIKKEILNKYSIISSCYSQVLYEVINEFFEVSKIKITNPKKAEIVSDEEKEDNKNGSTDKKTEEDEEKEAQNQSDKENKSSKSKSDHDSKNGEEQNFDDLVIVGNKIDVPEDKTQIQKDIDENEIFEEDRNQDEKNEDENSDYQDSNSASLKEKNSSKDLDENDITDEEQNEDKEENEDKKNNDCDENKSNSSKSDKEDKIQKSNSDKSEEIVDEQDNLSSASKNKEKDSKIKKVGDEDEEDKASKKSDKGSKKGDKKQVKKIKREVIYKLRNPETVKQLYESRNKLVKMNQDQIDFVQYLIDQFVNKVNNLKEEIENVNSITYYKFFPKIEKSMNDYIDLETIQNYIISLIQNYQNLVIPYLDDFQVKNVKKENNDCLYFFDETKSHTKFLDYLIHITLITNYESQEIFNYILFNSFHYKEQDINKKLIRQIFLKTISLLKQITSQPDFLTNFKISVAFDGILNFFKNVLENIDDKKKEDGLLILSIFQQLIHNASSVKELELLFYLEIFNIYEKAYNYIANSIYGDDLNPDKEIEFVSEHFLSYFSKDKIQESLQMCSYDQKSILSSVSDDDQYKKLYEVEWEFEDESSIYQQYPIDETLQFNIFKEVKNSYFLYLVIKNQKSFKQKNPPKNFEKNSLESFSQYFDIFKKVFENNKTIVESSLFKNTDSIKYLKNIYNQTQIEIKSNNLYYYQVNQYLEQQKTLRDQLKLDEQKKIQQEQQGAEQANNQSEQELKKEIHFVDDIVEKEIEEQYTKVFSKLEYCKQGTINNEKSKKNDKEDKNGKEGGEEEENKKKIVDVGDEKDFVCPTAYGFESNDLEKFGIDRKLYISLNPEQRQNLLEQKKKEHIKKEKEKKIKVIREREKHLLDNIFGNKEDCEKNKSELQKYLKSKEFQTIVKDLSKDDQRLILLTQDNEYLKMLDNNMKKKAHKFMNKQKISKKKKKRQTDKNNEKSKTFKKLNKIFKSTEESKEQKKQEKIMERINKSLQIPLLDEDVIIKMSTCWLSCSYNLYIDIFNNILQKAFINPFNYLRILGLILLIASKIVSNTRFDIPWLDHILFSSHERFLNSQKQNKGETEEDQLLSYRNLLLENCTTLIKQMLIEKKYGIIILQFEEFLFGKEFDKVEIVIDKSDKVKDFKPQVYDYNLLNENRLKLSNVEYNHLSFKDQFNIVTKFQDDSFKNINDYILGVLNLCTDKKKIGFYSKKEDSDKAYGKEYIDFIDHQSNQLIETTLELFCNINQKIKYTNLKINNNPEKIKNSIFRDKFKTNSFTILNMKGQVLIKSHSKKQIMPIFEKIFNHIILYGKRIESYGTLNELLKDELSNYDQFIHISDFLLSEYGIQMKKVVDDVLPALKQYKLYLKTKYNKDNLYENILDEDGNDINYNLKEPISTLLSNIYSFQQEYMHSYYKNLKIIIDCIDNLLEQRMKHYFEEFQQRKQNNSKDDAQVWWNERENLERQTLYDEIRMNWMEETKPLSQFYAEFFEFVHICLKLQQVTESNIPSYYGDFEICLKSFLRIYNTFYLDHKQKDDSLDQEEVITNEDEIQMPVLKRISTLSPNDLLEGGVGEEEEQPSLTELKTLRKYSSMLHKNYHSIKAEDLYEALKTKFVPLINRFMNNRKNNMWVILMSELNQGKMSVENKLCYVKAISRKENKNRSNGDDYFEMNCEVDREEIWYSIYKVLSGLPPSSLVTEQFDINFKDEDGIDAGGLSREFYTRVFKDLLDPSKGFFCPSSNGITTQPSLYSNIIPDHLLHFKYAGRLVAKSILDSFSCEIDFTRSFLKQILGKDLYINDLEDIDPDLAKNLIWILDNDVSNLFLDFTYTHNEFGKQQIIELKPNGSHIEVNEENKKEYVKLLAHYRMVKQIEPQIKSFQQGFYEVIPYKAIKIFTVRELGFKLSGQNIIDLEDLKANLNYSTYTKDSEQIIWLFEILEEYNQEQRAGFLFFITGSFRVPYGGFTNFKITISKLSDTQSLPVAHTCSKEMELPSYETKQTMKEKLEIAFMEGAKGFYIG